VYQLVQGKCLGSKVGWQAKAIEAGIRMRMKPIPDYGDLMTIDDFTEMCFNGALIDYDGCGRYSDGKEIDIDVGVYPSDIVHKQIDHKWSHVVWFNR
jgi:hypothetical protein